MLTFPCFEIRGRFDGGMSGGPVFNDAGHCCGVVCACADYGDGQYVSYATTLWPALWTPLTFATPNIIYRRPYQVGELCALGIIHAVDWNQFEKREIETITDDPFGYRPSRVHLKPLS